MRNANRHEPVDVFFYSYYQDESLLLARGADPRRPRPAELRGWRLRLGQYSNLVRAPEHSAWGTVFSLTHEEIDDLYNYPGVPAYRPEAVLVRTAAGRPLPALCFRLRDAHDNGKPDPAHVENLRRVMLARGIPVDGLDEAVAPSPELSGDASNDAADLQTHLAWLRPLLRQQDERAARICECGTARLADQSRDPDRFVAVFCAYAFLDQFIYTHIRHAHAQFKGAFDGPRLQAHGGSGPADPFWLLDQRGHGQDAIDLPRVKALFEGLVAEGLAWIARNADVPLEHCAAALERELQGGFFQVGVVLDSDAILARALVAVRSAF